MACGAPLYLAASPRTPRSCSTWAAHAARRLCGDTGARKRFAPPHPPQLWARGCAKVLVRCPCGIVVSTCVLLALVFVTAALSTGQLFMAFRLGHWDWFADDASVYKHAWGQAEHLAWYDELPPPTYNLSVEPAPDARHRRRVAGRHEAPGLGPRGRAERAVSLPRHRRLANPILDVIGDAPSNVENGIVITYRSLAPDGSIDRNSSVLSVTKLQQACRLENKILKHPAFQRVCVTLKTDSGERTNECARQPASVAGLFYGGQEYVEGVGYAGRPCQYWLPPSYLAHGKKLLMEALHPTVNTSDNIAAAGRLAKLLLPHGTSAASEPSAMRSFLLVSSRRSDLRSPLSEIEPILFDALGMSGGLMRSPYRSTGKLRNVLNVELFSETFVQLEFLRMAYSDMFILLAAGVYVLVVLSYAHRSAFLAVMGTGTVILSIPFSFWVYKFVLGIAYFTELQMLASLIAIGVGIDDYLVLLACWKRTDRRGSSDVEHMAATLDLAGVTVLTTTLTSMVCLLVTAVSPLVPISAFGVFAAVCVFTNFVLDMTVSPCIILLWHTRVRGVTHTRPRAESAAGAPDVGSLETGADSLQGGAVPSGDYDSASGIKDVNLGRQLGSDAAHVAGDMSAELDCARPPPSASASDVSAAPHGLESGVVGACVQGAPAPVLSVSPQQVGFDGADKETGACAINSVCEDAADVRATQDEGLDDRESPGVEADEGSSVAAATAIRVASATGAALDVGDEGSSAIDGDDVTVACAGGEGASFGDAKQVDATHSEQVQPDDCNYAAQTMLPRVAVWLRDVYIPWLTHTWAQVGLLACFVAAVVPGSVWGANMKPIQGALAVFPSNHMFFNVRQRMEADFPSFHNDTLTVVWGIEGVDDSGTTWWDPDAAEPVVIFRPGPIPLHEPAVRQHLHAACALLRNATCAACFEGAGPGVDRTPPPLLRQVVCHLERIEDFYANITGDRMLPTVKADMDRVVWQYQRHVRHTWNGEPGKQRETFALGGHRGSLRNYAITAAVPYNLHRYDIARRVYKRANEVVDEINEGHPEALGPAFQTCDSRWAQVRSADAMLVSLVQSVTWGLPILLLLLVVLLRSVRVAVYALVGVCGVVIFVQGFEAHFLGWTLGPEEVLSTVVSVGFAIDYIVHLAHRFANSPRKTVTLRVTDAAVTMGTTAIVGAATTLGATLLMFACQLRMATQLAMLLSLVSVLSLVVALGPFLAACLLFGG